MAQNEAIEFFEVHFDLGRSAMYGCYADNTEFKEFLQEKARHFWKIEEPEEDCGTYYRVFMPEGTSKDAFRKQLHELEPKKPVYEMAAGI